MLTKFFDTLANMGIWIRLNDNRTDPPSEQGREWGAPVGGFALSIANSGSESVSVLLKNLSDTEKRTNLPDWLRYLQIEISGPDNSPAQLKAYGKQLLDSLQQHRTERIFCPGQYLATEIPIGALYDLHEPGEYRVRVSCPVPNGMQDGILSSNRLSLRLTQ